MWNEKWNEKKHLFHIGSDDHMFKYVQWNVVLDCCGDYDYGGSYKYTTIGNYWTPSTPVANSTVAKTTNPKEPCKPDTLLHCSRL